MLSREYCKISKNSFFCRTPLMAASGLKSNVSNVNLNQSKKKLFLYFDDSHANWTNTAKKIWFFCTLLRECYIWMLQFSHEWKSKGDWWEETLFQACIIKPHILIKHRQLCSKMCSQVLFAHVIYHPSKHFYACGCTSLPKRPGLWQEL